MLQIKSKLATAIATGAVLANVLMPIASADTDLTISGNGSNSSSSVDLTKTNTNVVTQDNTADITNDITTNSVTGNNSADDNTGGNVRVDTGNANTDVRVLNQANQNVANIDGCCNTDTNVRISGNGSRSDNTATVNQSNSNYLTQTNDLTVDNTFDLNSNTGNNSADDNTGGDVRLDTGNASVDARAFTEGNANMARIGGSGTNAGSLSAVISGNGSRSDNTIDLTSDNTNVLDQYNSADITNDFTIDADTGYNSVDGNTGGDVRLDTGRADIIAVADNRANFNVADANCGCLMDVNARISGNGSRSDNTISADLSSDNFDTQNNDATYDNYLDLTGDTGYNSADDNTGRVNGSNDTLLRTGRSDTTVLAQNRGDLNAYGSNLHLPSVSFDFDMDGLMSWFMSSLPGIGLILSYIQYVKCYVRSTLT